MDIEDLHHLRMVVRLLRVANDAVHVRDDQAETLDAALQVFLTRYGLNESDALPILETLAFPDRDR